MFFSDICSDYLAYAEHERGLASKTIHTYGDWLSYYRRWADAEGVEATFDARFNPTVLRKYLYSLSKSGKRPRTIRNAFAPLRSVGVYLIEQGVITVSPLDALKMPQKDAPSRPVVSGQEVVALLGACERMRDDRRRARAKAMLLVMALCGLRFQEILDIRVQDVRLDMRTLLVAHGKGEKSRTLHPSPSVLEALAEWMREREKMNVSHDWLWAFSVSRRVGEAGFREMLEDLKSSAGLAGHKHIMPHAFRRFFAQTLNHASGLNAAKSALGHSDLNTTFAYLQSAGDPARAMANLDAALPLPQNQEAQPASRRADAFARRRRTPAR